MNIAQELMPLVVKARRQLTSSIVEFTLMSANGQSLSEFTPGSHMAIETPSGAMRRYSLVNDGNAPISYMIAVKWESDSRGGSSSMHQQALVETRLLGEKPQNDFPLVAAEKYLLIAGGIGITPILSMARALVRENKNFRLIYCTRSPDETAYLDEINTEFIGNLRLHHDDGDPARLYDFWDDMEKPDNSHVYCCGPAQLMEEIKSLTGHWPDGHIHFEDFKPVEVVRPDDLSFNVKIAATSQTIHVPAERTILEAVRDAGIKSPSSCESGTCGTCKVRLLEGNVDHRDMVLMEDEKMHHIMICVSRSLAGDLVIDLG
jgi:phthalate 4,5-dioxygenase reductase subunit